MLVAALVAVAIGVPTGIIRTQWYTRMTPVLWWSYPVWALTALLSGLLAATHVRCVSAASRTTPRVRVGAGVLSLLAVGCPACNKLVVLTIGVTGATTIWAPVQLLLDLLSLGLMGWALRRRLIGERRCPVG